MNDNLEHICPQYRTVTKSIPDGAPIYLTDTMWFERHCGSNGHCKSNAGQWWMGEEDIVCPVRFCPFCGLELKSLEDRDSDV